MFLLLFFLCLCSVYDSRPSFFSQTMETKQFIAKEEHEKLTCCAECTSNFENEVQHLKSFQSKQVPSWLQQYNVNQSHSKVLKLVHHVVSLLKNIRINSFNFLILANFTG